uniref:Uncharacterized protein n=1 Tax=Arundo donax TaxID=35708 RepID=A0A0A8ZS39_ARUDO
MKHPNHLLHNKIHV